MDNIKLARHSNSQKVRVRDYTSNDGIEDVLSNGNNQKFCR